MGLDFDLYDSDDDDDDDGEDACSWILSTVMFGFRGTLLEVVHADTQHIIVCRVTVRVSTPRGGLGAGLAYDCFYGRQRCIFESARSMEYISRILILKRLLQILVVRRQQLMVSKYCF